MILCSPSDSMWTILSLWCRLFQLNTDISQKKFYQLINSLSRNTFPPWKSLIGHGQVGLCNSFNVTFFFSFPFFFLFFGGVGLLSVNSWYWLWVPLFAAVYFLYDLSPITVTIREERRSFLHFITRLCAVLGGTFALTGLCPFSIFLFAPKSLFGKQKACSIQLGRWVKCLLRNAEG
jgi:hypothetical protein